MNCKAIIIAGLFVMTVAAYSQESITLRYKPEVGKAYRYKWETKTTSEGDVASTASLTELVEVYQCLEATEKALTLSLQIESRMVSQAKESGLPNLPPHLQKPQELVMVSDLPEIVKDSKFIFESSPLGAFKKFKEKLPNGLDKMLGFAGKYSGSPTFGLIYPKDKLAIGKGWEQKTDGFSAIKELLKNFPVKLNIEKQVVLALTLKSIGDHNGRKTAVIEYKGTGTATLKPTEGVGKGLIYTKTEGHFEVDLETGMHYSSIDTTTYHFDLSGEDERVKAKFIVITKNNLVE